MEKPGIAIGLYERNYSGYIALGNRVAAAMASNVHYLDPSPSVSSLQSAIDEAVEAQTQWGLPGNRGSHEDLVNLRLKTIVLAQMLNSMAKYVQNTATIAAGTDYARMRFIMSTSGFDLKKTKTPQGLLLPVQNLHGVLSPALNCNQVKLDWDRPAEVTSKTNVQIYMVYRGTTPVFSEAKMISAVRKTTFTDTNTSGQSVTWFYWIVPVGAAGNGAVSNVLSLFLSAM